jgi:hypothetical protein
MAPGPTLDELVKSEPRLEASRNELMGFAERTNSALQASFWKELTAIKSDAVTNNDQLLAKACWCLEQIARAQDNFVVGFTKGKQDDFYGFWCDLEQCDIALKFLGRHYPIEDVAFSLSYLQKHVPQFQELFPYRYFGSPGIVVKERVCSICGALFKLRSGCEHVVGEIYNGEMCSRILLSGDLLEVSIVDSPVHKYSVIFGPDITYDYGAVRYVLSGHRSPWHGWTYEIRTIIDGKERFPGTGRNQRCPCGSGKKYKKCCQLRAREHQHYEMFFEESPPSTLPAYIANGNYRVTGIPNSLQDPRQRDESE